MLRWLEGFESFEVTNGNNGVGVTGKYTGSPGTTLCEAGRVSGHSLHLGGFGTLYAPVFTANDTWIVGFALYFTKIAGEQELLQIMDGNNIQDSLSVSPDGELRFYRGDTSNNRLGTTTGARVRAGNWTYIEVKVKIHGSTGTVDVHVNGVSVLSLTGQNTDRQSTLQATKIGLNGSSAGGDLQAFDDWYICDKSGSNNNTFLGPQKVVTVSPTGDHGTNQYTPTGAGTTHADRVKEIPHDSSTTYLSDVTSTDLEEWDYANTGSEISSIKGIQVNTVFETDSASAFSLKNHINSGGTSSDDAGTAGVNGTYNTSAFVAELDPNTSALWTKTNFDAAIFGVKTV